ncbi:uncharacterized protein LOC143856633 [Tasmannia lanceolata]|uniref:uncharacterized protein LOC143856633 n=1 Tax=Tasmannia lanceolata TaxID=3420 RepID=UPI0040636FD1
MGGLGAIIRNSVGTVQAVLSVNVESEPIYELEMLAIEKGVAMARVMGLDQIWIESDSKFAVDVVKGRAKTTWKKKNLIEKLSVALSLFRKWHISHSWREGNRAADFLSKRDCVCKGTIIQLDQIPQPLLEILQEDREGKIYYRT